MRKFIRRALLAALGVCALQAQSSTGTQAAFTKKIMIGGLVTYAPLKMITGGNVSSTNLAIHGSDASKPMGFGLVAEIAVKRKYTIALEGIYRRSGYNLFSDFRDTNGYGNTITERTLANYWDIPALFRMKDWKEHGIRSHMFYEIGPTYRLMTNIRTHNSLVTYSQITSTGTTTTTIGSVGTENEIPATPAHGHQFGATAGVGLRFADEFKIKVTPEIRYTYWTGAMWATYPIDSAHHQVEAVVAITF